MGGSLFERLLVPTDGSQDSVDAGRLAFRIASRQDSQVTLLHVLDLLAEQQAARFSEKSESDIRAQMEREAEVYLDQLDSIASEYDLSVDREVREGDPHKQIVALAQELGVDLIVMGHAGRRGPRRKLMGSVAERVIRFSTCPVLIAKGGSG